MTGTAAKPILRQTTPKPSAKAKKIMSQTARENAWKGAFLVIGLLTTVVGYGIQDKLSTIQTTQTGNATLARTAMDKAKENASAIKSLAKDQETVAEMMRKIEGSISVIAERFIGHVEDGGIHERPEVKRNRLVAVLTEFIDGKVPTPEVRQALDSLGRLVAKIEARLENHDQEFDRFSRILARLEAKLELEDKKGD